MAARRVLMAGTREVWVEPDAVTGFIALRTRIGVPNGDPAERSRVSATVYVHKIEVTGPSPRITSPTITIEPQGNVFAVEFTVTDVRVTFTLDVRYDASQGIDPSYAGFGQVVTTGLARQV